MIRRGRRQVKAAIITLFGRPGVVAGVIVVSGERNLEELLGLSGIDRQGRVAVAMKNWRDAVIDVVRSLDLEQDDPRLAALTDESKGMIAAFQAVIDEQVAETERRIKTFRASAIEDAEKAGKEAIGQRWRELERRTLPYRVIFLCVLALLVVEIGLIAGLYVAKTTEPQPPPAELRLPPRAPLPNHLLEPLVPHTNGGRP
jgi:hypothetical protein